MNADNAIQRGAALSMRGGSLEDADIDQLMKERTGLRHKMEPYTVPITQLLSVRCSRVLMLVAALTLNRSTCVARQGGKFSED